MDTFVNKENVIKILEELKGKIDFHLEVKIYKQILLSNFTELNYF